jgi:hypothetical protein
MKRFTITIVAAIALTLGLALPSGAAASTNWVCQVPGEGTVIFVSASDAAYHGISTANGKAGAVFNRQFGEVCTVVRG